YVVGQKRDDKSGKCYRLHRVITKAKLDDVVDHKNGNGLDNRLENLRVTNSTGNNRNARKRKNSTSKYKGVSKKDNSYTVQIQISKDKYKFKSGIKSEEEAARLYNEWAIKY
ncbi:MAG: HNH endonuclease, partial [bacterium]